MRIGRRPPFQLLLLLQVEEHNGHVFKSTQYSIPTYCEFCSSLIWMMDRACVCKREWGRPQTLCSLCVRLCRLPRAGPSVRLSRTQAESKEPASTGKFLSRHFEV